MHKCIKYPNCDCYNEWEKPANEIDPGNSELFATIVQELDIFCSESDYVRYKPVLKKVKSKLELLPHVFHGLFMTKTLSLIKSRYLWKMPEMSDLIRLKKFFLKQISSERELSYYQEERNIPNQQLVIETIEYFEKGQRQNVFKPLEFLNLLDKQFKFVVENIQNTETIISCLKTLPLDDVEKHILFCFILKWFGGYPLSAPSSIRNSKLYYDFKKQLLEIFLGFDGETPEKEFCKGSFEMGKKLRKVSHALEIGINYNIDAVEVYNKMSQTRAAKTLFTTFDEMFDYAFQMEVFGEYKGELLKSLTKERYRYQFKEWLLERKGWEFNNEMEYQKYLTKDTFIEFLKHDKEQEQQRIAEQENEKKSWGIESELYSNQVKNKLSDLAIDNEHFNKWKEDLQSKLKATLLILNPDEFINAEIERVEKEYSRPTVKVLPVSGEKVLGRFDYYDYVKLSFDWLISGQDKPIESVVNSAKANFKLAFQHNPGLIEHSFSSGEFEKNIINSLSVGVGFLLYRKYLKDTINPSENVAMFNNKDIFDFGKVLELINTEEKLKNEQIQDGFQGLEKYIKENVYNDVNAELIRLEQLNRELRNWKSQIGTVFIEPENQHHSDSDYFNRMKQNAERMQRKISGALEILNLRIEHKKKQQSQQAETKPTHEIKPKFKPEAIQTIFDIIKDFFSTENQNELKQILHTGNIASEKLLFTANGNRLTDTFKKLIEHDFIPGYQKKDLINWIISNFTFMHQNKVKPFVFDTVEKTISRNYYPCKSPLIEIKRGQIEKAEQPRKRKQSKY